MMYAGFLGSWSLGDDVRGVSGIMVHNCGGIDVVGVGAVDQRIEKNSVVIVGEFVRVSVLLLVFNLEGDRGRVRFGFVCTKPNPLLLQSLLVLEVVLHVGEDHVAGGDVHGAYPGFFLP